jgi:ribonuclease P protein subunit POP4
MYDQLSEDFFCDQAESNAEHSQKRPLNVDQNADRDIFVESLLTDLLGEEKQREKSSLVEKIKYKKHQLDLSSKQIRKEAKLKQQQLSIGSNSLNKKESWQKRKLVINCKLKKQLRMYKLDKNEKLDYEKYLKINSLWKNYAASCLLTCLPKEVKENESANILNEENVLNCLKQIDYHGCHLTIKRSNSKTLIGLSGIVLQDRKNVFFILSEDNQIKIVPKAGSLFEFELFDTFKLTLVGSNMLYKPEMRVTKHAKIKTKLNIK